MSEAGARIPTGLLVVLSAAAALAAGPRGTAAQEAGGVGPEGRSGWLGVGLQETLVCPDGEEGAAPEAVLPEDCRPVFVAEAVIRGSPADEAGVQPGDTLIALNGRPLASRRGLRALRSMRPGRPVEALVGGAEGRESLRVVPAPRPPEVDRVALRTPLAPPGRLRVSPGMFLRWSRALGGAERPEMPAGGEAGAAIRVDRQGRVYLQGDGELVRLQGVEADRIRELRDSVMREVRQRLGRLRQERAAARETPEERPGPSLESLVRAAGAEFGPLEPERAERLAGVDRGLLVLRVLHGTPAAELGLEPGDVVVEANGRPTVRPAQLREVFRGLARGDSVVLRWIREGEAASGTLRR